MFYINESRLIEKESKKPNAKVEPAKSNPFVHDSFKQNIWNMIDVMGDTSVYELSHWTANQSRWIRNREVMKVRDYDRSSIVMADLGASNFGYEFSFVHPAVVIQNMKEYIFIAPCSSSPKRLSRPFPELIKATAIDGFAKDTAIIMNNSRWIHKNRVLRTVGKVSSRVLDEIDKYMLSLVPTYRKDVILKEKLEAKEKEHEDLQKEVAALKQKEQLSDMLLQFVTSQEDLYARFLAEAKEHGIDTVELEVALHEPERMDK